MLPGIGKAFPDWQISTVSLSERRRSDAVLQGLAHSSAEHFAAIAPGQATLMARFGNRDGALPFTAALDSQGRLCATYRGALRKAVLNAIAQRCQ